MLWFRGLAASNCGLQVPVVARHVEQLSCHVASPETSTENGISLLDVKVQLLLRLAAPTSPNREIVTPHYFLWSPYQRGYRHAGDMYVLDTSSTHYNQHTTRGHTF